MVANRLGNRAGVVARSIAERGGRVPAMAVGHQLQLTVHGQLSQPLRLAIPSQMADLPEGLGAARTVICGCRPSVQRSKLRKFRSWMLVGRNWPPVTQAT